MRAIRTLVAVSLLLAISAPAHSSEDPFAGWSAEKVAAHRETEGEVLRDRVEAWLRLRSAVLVTCFGCRGRGYHRTIRGRTVCIACKGSGRRIDRDVDTSGFGAFYVPGRAEKLEGRDWYGVWWTGAWDRHPRILSSYRVVEVRVRGHQAVLFAFTRSCRGADTREDPPERPEIVWWVRHEGTWLIHGRDHDDPGPGHARYPNEHWLRPRTDPAAEHLIEKGRSLQALPKIPAGKRLAFRGSVSAKALRRAVRFAGVVTPSGYLGWRKKSSARGYEAFAEEDRLIYETLRRLLATGVAPDPTRFHVRHDGATPGLVVFEAFSPLNWPEAWKVRFGDSGPPVSIEARGEGSRIDVTWKETDGRHRPVEFVSARMNLVVEYVKFADQRLPKRLELEMGGRQVTVKLSGYRFR